MVLLATGFIVGCKLGMVSYGDMGQEVLLNLLFVNQAKAVVSRV